MLNRFGRRTIFLYGLCSIFVTLLVVGFLSLGPTSTSLSWAIGAFLLIFTLLYDSTIGPLTCESLLHSHRCQSLILLIQMSLSRRHPPLDSATKPQSSLETHTILPAFGPG